MSIYKSDIVVESSVDKDSDLIMHEKRVVKTYLLGIRISNYSFERTTSPYEGESVVSKSGLGFKTTK